MAKLVSISEYTKNIIKSTLYAADDVTKSMMPAYSEFREANDELFKEAYKAVKDYRKTFRRVQDAITKSKVYEAGQVAIDNAFDDIKTGKLYNKERENAQLDKTFADQGGDSGDFGMGLSFDDSAFGDLDKLMEDTEAPDEGDITKGDTLIAGTIESTTKASTNALATATIKGFEANIKNQRIGTSILYSQGEKAMHINEAGFSMINGTAGAMLEFLKGPANKFFENSAQYYSEASKDSKELNAMVKEILEMKREEYKRLVGEEEKEKKKKLRFGDIVGATGMPDLKAYAEVVKENALKVADEELGLGALTSMLDNEMLGDNPLLAFAQNPLGGLMTMVLSTAIGPKTKHAAENLDKTMSGIFSTIIGNFNQMKKSDNKFMEILGKVFGISDRVQSSLNPGEYKKGAIPFDGETKKAITEVIPGYLASIEAALTGQNQRFFDYERGMFRSGDELLRSFKDIRESAKRRSTSDVMSSIMQVLGNNKIMFDTKEKQDRFYKDLQTLQDYMFANPGDKLGPEWRKQKAAEKKAAKDKNEETEEIRDMIREIGFRDEENGKIILEAIAKATENSQTKYKTQGVDDRTGWEGSKDRRVWMQLQNEVSDAKKKLDDQMKEMQRVNNMGYNNLFNNAYTQIVDEKTGLIKGDYRGVGKSVLDRMDIAIVKDPKNSQTVFDYLDNIYGELKYIRVVGMGSGQYGAGFDSLPTGSSAKQILRKMKARRMMDETAGMSPFQRKLYEQGFRPDRMGLKGERIKSDKEKYNERQESEREWHARKFEEQKDKMKESGGKDEWGKKKKEYEGPYLVGWHENADREIVADKDDEETFRRFSAHAEELRQKAIHDIEKDIKQQRTWFSEQWHDHVEEVGKNHEEDLKVLEKKGFLDALIHADSLGGKAAVFVTGLQNMLAKPGDYLAGILERADEKLYSFFYEEDEMVDPRTGKKVTGFFGRLKAEMSNTFDEINTWLNEKVLEPLKEKLGVEDGWINWAKKGINSMFGIDVDAIWGGFKQSVSDAFQPIKDAVVGNVTEFFSGARRELEEDYAKARKKVDELTGNTEEGETTPSTPTVPEIQQIPGMTAAQSKQYTKFKNIPEEQRTQSQQRYIDMLEGKLTDLNSVKSNFTTQMPKTFEDMQNQINTIAANSKPDPNDPGNRMKLQSMTNDLNIYNELQIRVANGEELSAFDARKLDEAKRRLRNLGVKLADYGVGEQKRSALESRLLGRSSNIRHGQQGSDRDSVYRGALSLHMKGATVQGTEEEKQEFQKAFDNLMGNASMDTKIEMLQRLSGMKEFDNSKYKEKKKRLTVAQNTLDSIKNNEIEDKVDQNGKKRSELLEEEIKQLKDTISVLEGEMQDAITGEDKQRYDKMLKDLETHQRSKERRTKASKFGLDALLDQVDESEAALGYKDKKSLNLKRGLGGLDRFFESGDKGQLKEEYYTYMRTHGGTIFESYEPELNKFLYRILRVESKDVRKDILGEMRNNFIAGISKLQSAEDITKIPNLLSFSNVDKSIRKYYKKMSELKNKQTLSEEEKQQLEAFDKNIDTVEGARAGVWRRGLTEDNVSRTIRNFEDIAEKDESGKITGLIRNDKFFEHEENREDLAEARKFEAEQLEEQKKHTNIFTEGFNTLANKLDQLISAVTNSIGGHAEGGVVTKTGLATVHEGEIIIPNPKEQQAQDARDEKKVKDGFLSELGKNIKDAGKGILSFAQGGVVRINDKERRSLLSRARKSKFGFAGEDQYRSDYVDKYSAKIIDFAEYVKSKGNIDLYNAIMNEDQSNPVVKEINKIQGISDINDEKAIDSWYEKARGVVDTYIKNSEAFDEFKEKVSNVVNSDEVQGIAKGVRNGIEGGKEFINQVLGTDSEKVQKAYDETSKTVKEYLPDIVGKGAVGGIIGTVLGGPLLGAVMGAGVGIVTHNQSFMESLFGKKIADKDGNETREGGLISRDIYEAMTKYLPSMRSYGIAGGLLGLITPFGPLGGALIGSAIGAVKKNEDFQEFLFGSEQEDNGLLSKAQQKWIADSLPNMGAAAIGGMLLGPFGLFGNMIVGAGTGLLMSSDKFKEFMLGKEDKNGKRHGGLAGALKEGFVDPLKESMIELKNGIVDFMKNDVFGNLKKAFEPLGKQIKMGMQSLLKGVSKTFYYTIGHWFETVTGRPVAYLIRDYFMKPIMNLGKNLVSTALKPVKWLAKKPFQAIGWLGDKLKARQIQMGNADYMTVAEREAFREEHGLNRDNEFAKFDDTLKGLDQNSMQEMIANLELYQHGTKKMEQNRKNAIKNLWYTLEDQIGTGGISADSLAMLGKNRRDAINQLLHDGKIEEAQKMLTEATANMDSKDRQTVYTTVMDAYSDYVAAKKAEKNYGDKKSEVEKYFKDTFGIDITGDKSDKYLGIIKKERDSIRAIDKLAREGDSSAIASKAITDSLAQGNEKLIEELRGLREDFKVYATNGGYLTEEDRANKEYIRMYGKSLAGQEKIEHESRALDMTYQLQNRFGKDINLNEQSLMYMDTSHGANRYKKIMEMGENKAKIKDIDKILQLNDKTFERVYLLGMIGYTATDYDAIGDMTDAEFDNMVNTMRLGFKVNSVEDYKKVNPRTATRIMEFQKVLGSDVAKKLSFNDLVGMITRNDDYRVKDNQEAIDQFKEQYKDKQDVQWSKGHGIKESGTGATDMYDKATRLFNNLDIDKDKEGVIGHLSGEGYEQQKDEKLEANKVIAKDLVDNIANMLGPVLAEALGKSLKGYAEGGDGPKVQIAETQPVIDTQQVLDDLDEAAKQDRAKASDKREDDVTENMTMWGYVKRKLGTGGKTYLANDKETKETMARMKENQEAVVGTEQNTALMVEYMRQLVGGKKGEVGKEKKKSWLDELFDKLGGMINGIIPLLAGLPGKIISAISGLGGTIVSGVLSAGTELLNGIKSFFTQRFKLPWETAEGEVSSLTKAANNEMDALKKKLANKEITQEEFNRRAAELQRNPGQQTLREIEERQQFKDMSKKAKEFTSKNPEQAAKYQKLAAEGKITQEEYQRLMTSRTARAKYELADKFGLNEARLAERQAEYTRATQATQEFAAADPSKYAEYQRLAGTGEITPEQYQKLVSDPKARQAYESAIEKANAAKTSFAATNPAEYQRYQKLLSEGYLTPDQYKKLVTDSGARLRYNTIGRVGRAASGAAELAGEAATGIRLGLGDRISQIRNSRAYQFLNPYDTAASAGRDLWYTNVGREIMRTPGAIGRGVANAGRGVYNLGKRAVSAIDTGITNALGEGVLGKGYQFGKAAGGFMTSGLEMAGAGVSNLWNMATHGTSMMTNAALDIASFNPQRAMADSAKAFSHVMENGTTMQKGAALAERGIEKLLTNKPADFVLKYVMKAIGGIMNVAGGVVGRLPGASPKAFAEAMEHLGTQIARKAGGKLAMKLGAKLLPLVGQVMMIKDAAEAFYDGMANPGAVLGIANQDQITPAQRCMAAVTKALIETATFGIVPADFIVGLVLKYVAPTLGIGEEMSKKREESQAAFEQYKLENGKGDDYSFEQYMKDIGTYNDNSFMTNISQGAGWLKDKAIEVGGDIVEGIKQVPSLIFEQFNKLGEYVKEKMVSVTSITDYFDKLTDRAATIIFNDVDPDKLEDLNQSIQIADDDPLKGIKESMREFAINHLWLMGSVGYIASGIGNAISGLGNMIGEGFTGFGGGISDTLNAVIEGKPGMLVSTVNKAWQTITGERDLTKNGGMGRLIGSGVAQLLLGSFAFVPSVLVWTVKGIKDAVGSIFDEEAGNMTTWSIFEPLVNTGDFGAIWDMEAPQGEGFTGALDTAVFKMEKPVALFMAGFNKLSSTLQGVFQSWTAGRGLDWQFYDTYEGDVFDAKYLGHAWEGWTDDGNPLGTLPRLFEQMYALMKAPGIAFGNMLKNLTGERTIFGAVGGVWDRFKNWVQGKEEQNASANNPNEGGTPKPKGTGEYNEIDYKNDSLAVIKAKKAAQEKVKNKKYIEGLNKYSQLNPAIANIGFNKPGDTEKQTIGDSYCVPMATSAALEAATGKYVNPMSMYNSAIKYKAKDDGVSTEFIKKEAEKYGINAQAVTNKAQIKSYIERGIPLVAAGKGMKPYGDNSYHEIAITGKDGSNAIIQNPESRYANNRYDMNQILDDTSIAYAMMPSYNRIQEDDTVSVQKAKSQAQEKFLKRLKGDSEVQNIGKVREELFKIGHKKLTEIDPADDKSKFTPRIKRLMSRKANIENKIKKYANARGTRIFPRGYGSDDPTGLPLGSLASYAANRLNYNHPEFLWAQMMHETGGPDKIEADNAQTLAKYGIADDHNYGGYTWYEGMGEDKKGVPRPADEGGYYAKFNSDAEYADKWVDTCLVDYSGIKTAGTPEEYAAALTHRDEDGASYYASGDPGPYAVGMRRWLEDDEYKNKLGNLGPEAGKWASRQTGGSGGALAGAAGAAASAGAVDQILGGMFAPLTSQYGKLFGGAGAPAAGAAAGASGATPTNAKPGEINNTPVAGNAVEALLKLSPDSVVTSPFGPRDFEESPYHTGVDLAYDENTKVFTPVSGTVVDATNYDAGGYGNLVTVKDKNNKLHYFAHNNEVLVQPGQQVQKGELVAMSGNTGHSFGAHLHYGILNDADGSESKDNFINPESYDVTALGTGNADQAIDGGIKEFNKDYDKMVKENMKQFDKDMDVYAKGTENMDDEAFPEYLRIDSDKDSKAVAEAKMKARDKYFNQYYKQAIEEGLEAKEIEDTDDLDDESLKSRSRTEAKKISEPERESNAISSDDVLKSLATILQSLATIAENSGSLPLILEAVKGANEMNSNNKGKTTQTSGQINMVTNLMRIFNQGKPQDDTGGGKTAEMVEALRGMASK